LEAVSFRELLWMISGCRHPQPLPATRLPDGSCIQAGAFFRW
jgi:hypothetical protein